MRGLTARFLRSDDDQWVETAKLVPSDGGTLGRDFAIDSRRVITTGTTYIFEYAQFSSVDPYLGNRANWTEVTPSRWSLRYDTEVPFRDTQHGLLESLWQSPG